MNKYQINFHAYEKSLADASPGHVYIEFVEVLNDSPIFSNKIGFYPKDQISREEAIRGNTEGVIKSDDSTYSNLNYLNEVSFTQFSAAKSVAQGWQGQSRNYKLLHNDCITFAEEIARAIGLSIPSRSRVILTPGNFVEQLRFEHLNYLKKLFQFM